jgi:hypothetical protein
MNSSETQQAAQGEAPILPVAYVEIKNKQPEKWNLF